MILGGVDVSGAVRESADYRGNYRTAIGGNDRQFCYYTQVENMIISSSV
jgi:hypothetical protein